MNRRPLYKTRFCFLSNSQYFEVDVFENLKGIILLEREKTSMVEETVIPSFIDVSKNVTGMLEYSNSELARIN